MFIDSEIENHFTREYVHANLESLNKKVINTSELVVVHCNIRSLNKNFNEMNVFLENLACDPGVIICTETWKLACPCYFGLQGYEMHYNESQINRADGVVVFVKRDLVSEVQIEKIGITTFLSITIGDNIMEKIKFTALYRCHDNTVKDFLNSVQMFLNGNKGVRNHFIIGDFNIDILKPDKNGEDFLNNFLERQYVPFFHTATRSIMGGEGSCIDNAYGKIQDINVIAHKLEYGLTDHDVLFLQIDRTRKKINQNFETYKIDYNKLLWYSNLENWDITRYNNIDDSINHLVKNVNRVIEKSKKSLVHWTRKDKARKPWITGAIIKSCNTKSILYKKWQKHPNDDKLKTEYKTYANKLYLIIDKAKELYEKSKVVSFGNDSKKLWQYVQEKTGNTTKKRETVKVLVTETGKIENGYDIANHFNEVFSGIGEKLAKEIPKANQSSCTPKKRVCSSLFLRPTNANEIELILNQLKNKAGGVDNIHTRVIKQISSYIIEPLAHIINMCFERGKCPSHFKMAEIVPIHKNGSKTEATNYRPISLISNFAKIFEKILHNRFTNFLNKHKIISNRQYGFKKNVGTKDALAFVSDFLYSNLDKSKPNIAVFLDLAKAFDTVNHEILLQKLEYYGIRGVAHKLVKDYLADRTQTVKIGNNKSSFRDVKIGVPQGTILGPLLFLIYINDLFETLPMDRIVSYADDTIILCTEENWTKTVIQANAFLSGVYLWLNANQLSLNVAKTVYITFANYIDSIPPEALLTINTQELKRVDDTKYLGVTIDANMKWKKNIENIVKRTRYLVYIFAKLVKIMDGDTLLKIYHGLFNGVASYGIVAWGSAYDNAMGSLARIQKRLVKIINKARSITVNKKLLNIKQTYALEILMHNYANLRDEYNASKKITRNKNIALRRVYLEVGKKSHVYMATELFNKLPNGLKNISGSNRVIKNKLKEWVLESC